MIDGGIDDPSAAFTCNASIALRPAMRLRASTYSKALRPIGHREPSSGFRHRHGCSSDLERAQQSLWNNSWQAGDVFPAVTLPG
jgi:hypothetical protein